MTLVTNIMTTSSSLVESNTAKTVEISKTDIELRNNRIVNEIINESDKAMNQKLKIKTLVLEYADNLEQLVERKLVPWSKEMIFSIIMNNLQVKGISSVGVYYVYQAFNHPEFNKFKYFRNHGWHPKQQQQQQQQQQLQQKQQSQEVKKLCEAEKSAISIQINDALFTLEQNFDNPLVKERLEKYFIEYEKQKKKAKNHEKDLSRICMEKPEPKDSNLQEMLMYLSKLAEKAASRVHDYPPLNEQDDIYFKNAVSLITDWIQSIADLKWSRSIYSWVGIELEKENQSTHSAMSKSKIECRSNLIAEINELMRKVTREQIDAKHPIIIKIASLITRLAEFTLGPIGRTINYVFHNLIEENHPLLLEIAARIIENCYPLAAISIYKDDCQAPWNGGFHVRRHDKLSESAFGNSTCV